MSATQFVSSRQIPASLQRFTRNRDGAAMVEFGLVFPMVLACFCGIMFFGTYLFNANRMDHALREVAREVMLLDSPTEGDVKNALDTAMAKVELPGEDSSVEIETSADGKARVAIIEVEMTMAKETGFLDIAGFTHTSSLHVPLYDR